LSFSIKKMNIYIINLILFGMNKTQVFVVSYLIKILVKKAIN
jgi:hypothetical protein